VRQAGPVLVVKPEGTTVFATETTWVYGCVDPIKMESSFLLLPSLISALMQLFRDTFAAAHEDTFIILLRDNSSTHKAKTLRIPAYHATCQ
jgi:hypothetical protein